MGRLAELSQTMKGGQMANGSGESLARVGNLRVAIVFQAHGRRAETRAESSVVSRSRKRLASLSVSPYLNVDFDCGRVCGAWKTTDSASGARRELAV
jgi:hypothetical protein